MKNNKILINGASYIWTGRDWDDKKMRGGIFKIVFNYGSPAAIYCDDPEWKWLYVEIYKPIADYGGTFKPLI